MMERIGPPRIATGDDVRWNRHTPQVWQAIAYQDPAMLPSIADLSNAEINQSEIFSPIGELALATYTPAVQIIRYALGWERNSLPYDFWAECGYQSVSIHLRIINHLLGRHVEDVREWLTRAGRVTDCPLLNGGYDAFHIDHHASAPMSHPDEFAFGVWKDADSKRILVDKLEYEGWYSTLQLVGEDVRPGTEIDILCRPVGWLGTFTRSPKTGIWHCTTEEIHTYGL